MTHEDRTLVRACQAGDAQAWETLIRRYQRLLYAIPLRCGLSEDDAADVFQTVCLRLLENLEKLRDERHLTGWLITTAKRESWRLYQLRQRQEALTVPERDATDDGDLESIPSPDLLPQDAVLRLEEEQLVRAGLERLAERCRRLLGMLYQADPPMSYEAVARALNVSVGAIGPTRARCLQQLRKVLQQLGF